MKISVLLYVSQYFAVNGCNVGAAAIAPTKMEKISSYVIFFFSPCFIDGMSLIFSVFT